jgi:hypothetical protein
MPNSCTPCRLIHGTQTTATPTTGSSRRHSHWWARSRHSAHGRARSIPSSPICCRLPIPSHLISACPRLNGCGHRPGCRPPSPTPSADFRGRRRSLPLPGPVAAKGTEAAEFAAAVLRNYRRTFFVAHPELRGLVTVHHAFERQVLKKYPGLFSEAELHALENLRGIPNELNSYLHLSVIRGEWYEFYKQSECYQGADPSEGRGDRCKVRITIQSSHRSR